MWLWITFKSSHWLESTTLTLLFPVIGSLGPPLPPGFLAPSTSTSAAPSDSITKATRRPSHESDDDDDDEDDEGDDQAEEDEVSLWGLGSGSSTISGAASVPKIKLGSESGTGSKRFKEKHKD